MFRTLFWISTGLLLWHTFAGESLVLGQPVLKCNPLFLYSVAKQDLKNQQLNESLVDVMRHALAQEEMMTSRVFEEMMTKSDFHDSFDLAVEIEAAIKEVDPNYHKAVSIRGVAEELAGKAASTGDMSDLFLFKFKERISSLSISQNQLQHLEKVTARIEQEIDNTGSAFSKEVRVIFSNRFSGLREVLNKSQFKKLHSIFGDPIMASDAIDPWVILSRGSVDPGALKNNSTEDLHKKLGGNPKFKFASSGNSSTAIDGAIVMVLFSTELGLSKEAQRRIERILRDKTVGILDSPFDAPKRMVDLLKGGDVYPRVISDELEPSQALKLSQLEFQLRHGDIFDFGLRSEPLVKQLGLNQSEAATVQDYASETQTIVNDLVSEARKKQMEILREGYSKAFKLLDAEQLKAITIESAGDTKRVSDFILGAADPEKEN